MHAVGARLPRGIDQTIDTEIALAGCIAADVHGTVGKPDVPRAPVAVRIHRDGLDPHVAAGADHAHRDLAAVRDENPLHRSERYVAVLLRRVLVALGFERLETVD